MLADDDGLFSSDAELKGMTNPRTGSDCRSFQIFFHLSSICGILGAGSSPAGGKGSRTSSSRAVRCRSFPLPITIAASMMLRRRLKGIRSRRRRWAIPRPKISAASFLKLPPAAPLAWPTHRKFPRSSPPRRGVVPHDAPRPVASHWLKTAAKQRRNSPKIRRGNAKTLPLRISKSRRSMPREAATPALPPLMASRALSAPLQCVDVLHRVAHG